MQLNEDWKLGKLKNDLIVNHCRTVYLVMQKHNEACADFRLMCSFINVAISRIGFLRIFSQSIRLPLI